MRRIARAATPLLLASVGLSGGVAAAEPLTENTLASLPPELRPEATIEDVAWLAGSWGGEAFGGTFEETWNPPSAGTMVGLFKLRHGDEVAFYELETIVEVGGSLELRVKHFEPDFVGWEEKDRYAAFPLVKLEPDAVWFAGLTLRREGPDLVRAYLAVGTSEGMREEELVWRRAPAAEGAEESPR
jgi:hypothetical protein